MRNIQIIKNNQSFWIYSTMYNNEYFYLCLFTVFSKLVLFVEVSRHGARAPVSFMKWDYKDNKWPQGPGGLTPEGLKSSLIDPKPLN
jgi:hypothetical protein